MFEENRIQMDSCTEERQNTEEYLLGGNTYEIVSSKSEVFVVLKPEELRLRVTVSDKKTNPRGSRETPLNLKSRI